MYSRASQITARHGSSLLKIALVALFIFAPTLFAPWSLIDDGRLVEQAAAVGERFQTEGFQGALLEIIKPEQNFNGPAMRLQVFLQYHVFGGSPVAWHGAKVLQLILVCWGVYFLGCLLGCRRTMAAAGACLFVVFDPPSAHGHFQSAIVNYARLFTTDSYFMVWAVWSSVFFLHALRPLRDREFFVSVGLFFFCFSNAALTKLTFLPNACAYGVVLGAWFYVAVFGEKSSRGRFIWLTSAFVASTSLGLLFFQPWAKSSVVGYEDVQLVTGLGGLMHNVAVYAPWLLEVTSALGVLAFFGLVFLAGREAVAFRQSRTLPARALALALVALLFSGTLVFQCLWPTIIPRYMIVFTPFFCALLARGLDVLLAPFLAELDSLGDKKWAIAILLALAGAVLWALCLQGYYRYSPPFYYRQHIVILSVGLLCAVAACASGAALFWRKKFPYPWLHAPAFVMIAGHAALMATFLTLHARGALDCYLAREHMLATVWQQSDVLAATLAEGETGTLYVNLEGEELGSIPMVNRHLRGINHVEVVSTLHRLPEIPQNTRSRTINFINVNAQVYGPPTPMHLGAELVSAPKFEEFSSGTALALGSTLDAEIQLEEPLALSNIQLNIDPLSWHSDLDLRIALSIGDAPFTEVAVVDSREAPRGRLGDTAVFLPQEIDLPAGVPLVFRLQPTPRSNVPDWRLAGAAINLPLFNSFNGKPLSAAAPSFTLRGSVPDGPRLQLLERTTHTGYERVYLSPFGIFLGTLAGAYWHEAHLPLANREYQFHLIAEVYGVPQGESQ